MTEVLILSLGLRQLVRVKAVKKKFRPQPLKNVQKTRKLVPEDSSFLGREQIVHFPLALHAPRPIKPGTALTD